MNADLHLNTGVMALDALPEDEAAEYAEHLKSCAMCTAELTGFLQTAAILGSSVAQAPPAELRRAVMQAVSQTVQLPPLAPGPDAAENALGRHRQVGPTPSAAAPAENAPGRTTDSDSLATVIPLHRPWYRRPQAFLAAAVAILLIGGGLILVLGNRSPARNSAVECVAAAPDKSVISPSVGNGGDISVSASCDAAVVNMPALPAAPSGKVYQLWVMRGKDARSIAVMSSNAGGPAAVVATEVHAGDTGVAVSLEPGPKGSGKPTTKPIWLVPISS